ncbi:MAG: nodulation factor ABC transporter ATP-binding protein NodI [Cupriavidus basilensis]|uniref:Nodulation factor ABC transporter ATP-binding protein NodI n=1 Tax=Cupriavidus basilensis TaxID=68895 RepID=A0A7M2GRB9_9BURK|nr:nodulation factor ABC transporter ATP-binding protein NodI [Cupriavidus basilensis]MCP3020978.1 nodulation factor ABC transporter ATP-binding protein NodI [Cupriavidus basilensis]MDR3382885.1 nodulation factor ABC transporter ATP-binding protein NodI [Cupriavidus basilensis]QOT75320.1 nodulation factor ABC transporter ATP-binding protein NodI [Cupriavidus basilensis]
MVDIAPAARPTPAPALTAILELRNVSKQYGDTVVVDDLSLSVQRGQCFGLLGPNGAGKTTTLRLLLGLTTPASGTLTLCGEPIPQRAPQARMRVGVVPQFDNLDPDFTVVENLRIFGRYFGLERAVIEARVPALLEFARLESRAKAQVRDLSGGMRRRLTVARALINDPDLLVMDEPTTGLDPQARHLIWERLKSLLANGKTILLTTHFMEEAERLCNYLCVIDSGRKIAEGKPHELIDSQIGCDVVEVYGDNLEPLRGELHPLATRTEMSGETLFCYVKEPAPLLAALHGRTGVRYLHRPANLEDVFLKLTGREMRD